MDETSPNKSRTEQRVVMMERSQDLSFGSGASRQRNTECRCVSKRS